MSPACVIQTAPESHAIVAPRTGPFRLKTTLLPPVMTLPRRRSVDVPGVDEIAVLRLPVAFEARLHRVDLLRQSVRPEGGVDPAVRFRGLRVLPHESDLDHPALACPSVLRL